MMHEREKSDTAVVAVKPANKAGATIAAAAESGEPRAGPQLSQNSRPRSRREPDRGDRLRARNLLASLPARTTVTFRAPDKAEKPKLHILAIGINDYVDQGSASQADRGHFPPLKLAVSDAKAFAAKMRAAGAGLYGEVHATEALDADATAANLDRIVSKMSARMGPRDTFVLFAAAHGTSRAGRFYLIPQDYQGGSDPKALTRRAIILLDTCELGALVSGYTKSRTDVAASEAAIGACTRRRAARC